MIDSSISDALAQTAATTGPGAALFDADGVLWHGDVSEDFTRWMLEAGHFKSDLWPRYEEVNREDPGRGCFEILHFYKGLSADEIDRHVQRFWEESPERRWIQRTLDTLAWVASSPHKAFVVSGTPAAVLQPLTNHLPELDGVLAMELEFDSSGRATGSGAGIPTVGPGKAERVRAEIQIPVILALGNSSLDIEMLSLSEGLAWAVNPDPALRSAAEQNGWLITLEGDS